MFDTNDSGVLPSSQFGNMLRAMGQSPSNKEIEDMIADCTINENGTISLGEVVRVIGTRGIKSEIDMRSELEEALRVLVNSACILTLLTL